MQISVVIPTYQRPQLLIKCLKALQSQSLPKGQFEVIVVTDGPDAASAKAVAKRRAALNIKCISLPEKKGPAAARNLGWLSAAAPIIAFTDDDCLPNVNWLRSMQTVADPSKPQAFTGRVIVPRSQRPTDYELNTAGLETADFVTANCACTKMALIAVGGFDERFSMAWREDSDLEFKLIRQNIPIKKIEEAVVLHPVRKSRWGISIKEQKKTLFNALLYRKYPDLYRQKIQGHAPALYYFIIISFACLPLGLVLHFGQLAILSGFLWLGLSLYFTVKRLYHTSLAGNHILEMLCTSMLIPFLSVYWQWYGALKYKVLFI